MAINEMKKLSSLEHIRMLQYKNKQDPPKAWGNSVYLAFEEKVSFGEVSGHGYLYTLKLRNPLNVIFTDDTEYSSGDIKDEKIPSSTIEYVTKELGFNEEIHKFMTFLGVKGYAFQCPLNESAQELIVPISLINHFCVVRIQEVFFKNWEAQKGETHNIITSISQLF